MRQTDRSFKFDWITILLFLALVIFGWFNIYSASSSIDSSSYFDLDQPFGKQLLFIILTLVLIIVILSLEAKFYERFSSVIYILSLISLLGLFIFGKTVSGATSWYGIGGMTIQPSEFAKAATALAVAKYISDMQTNIKVLKDQIRLLIIIAIPAVLILLQNDTGSTIVYGSFFFVLFREGLPRIYLYLGALFLIVAILTLKFGIIITFIVSILLISIVYLYFIKPKKRSKILTVFTLSLLVLGFSFIVNYVYENKLPSHQKDRISLWLRLEKDPDKLERMKKTYAYNLLESEKAISSGGKWGKGFQEGTTNDR